jgi:hypothetical protein
VEHVAEIEEGLGQASVHVVGRTLSTSRKRVSQRSCSPAQITALLPSEAPCHKSDSKHPKPHRIVNRSAAIPASGKAAKVAHTAENPN